jgi:hypothetical protein
MHQVPPFVAASGSAAYYESESFFIDPSGSQSPMRADERDCKGLECQIGRGRRVVCAKDWGMDEAHQHRGQLLDLLRRVAALELLYEDYRSCAVPLACAPPSSSLAGCECSGL